MRAHNLGAVISFEFLRTVRKPRFWLISLSVPLLIAVVVGLVTLSGQTTAERADNQDREPLTFSYTDASGLIDPAVARAAGGTLVADAAAARAAVAAGTAECHVDYPKDPLSQPIDVRGRDLGLFESSRYGAVALAVFRTSVTNRIGDPALARLATAPPDVQLVTYADGSPTPGIAGVIAPGIFLVLFYLAVIMLGNQMLNVTLEEKENRVTEMILTTMNPTTLIVGKVLGLLAVGVLQMIIFAVPSLLIFSLVTPAVDPQAARELSGVGFMLDPGRIAIGLLLFLGGFLMFTGMLVAIGSIMPNSKEASGAFGAVVMVMFIPFYAGQLIVADPHGLVAQVLTFFPLTSPVTALVRNAIGGLNGWEAALCLVLLFGFALLFLRIGVRLFRTGSISYDVRLSLRKIFIRS